MPVSPEVASCNSHKTGSGCGECAHNSVRAHELICGCEQAVTRNCVAFIEATRPVTTALHDSLVQDLSRLLPGQAANAASVAELSATSSFSELANIQLLCSDNCYVPFHSCILLPLLVQESKLSSISLQRLLNSVQSAARAVCTDLDTAIEFQRISTLACLPKSKLTGNLVTAVGQHFALQSLVQHVLQAAQANTTTVAEVTMSEESLEFVSLPSADVFRLCHCIHAEVLALIRAGEEMKELLAMCESASEQFLNCKDSQLTFRRSMQHIEACATAVLEYLNHECTAEEMQRRCQPFVDECADESAAHSVFTPATELVVTS